ncbi:hypothetical protein [Salinicoccus sp. Marseille-QA3877]
MKLEFGIVKSNSMCDFDLKVNFGTVKSDRKWVRDIDIAPTGGVRFDKVSFSE